jgi:hypothetical protein
MSAEQVLDAMAGAHFHEWLGRSVGARALTTAYSQLPDTERAMRREAMRPVLDVVVKAFDDEVLVDAMNAGDIAMHQAADLSQRFDQWLHN